MLSYINRLKTSKKANTLKMVFYKCFCIIQEDLN